MDNSTDKVKFVRNGITRSFSKRNIEAYSTETEPWPESQGWVRVSEEVVDTMKLKESIEEQEKAAKAAAAKAAAAAEAMAAEDAKAAAAPSPDAKTTKRKSSDFKTTNEDLVELKKYIDTLAQSEIEEFFDGETRATILNHKP